MAKKLHFEITVNAPRQKLWETMLGDATYPQWTEAFGPGGSYKGKWEAGSKMLFLGPSEVGQSSGMVSIIKEFRPYEFLSIHHIGILENGVEKTDSATVAEWGDALENYTLQEENGSTKLLVDMDSADQYVEMFNKQWPVALAKLKALAEKSTA